MGKLKLQTGVLSLKCVHYVEVKAVDKHRWDDKDSRYSEICVKGFPKRWNKRWNSWWWQIKVVKAHVKKHVFNSMYSINKAIIIIYYEKFNIISVFANYCHKWIATNMTGMQKKGENPLYGRYLRGGYLTIKRRNNLLHSQLSVGEKLLYSHFSEESGCFLAIFPGEDG